MDESVIFLGEFAPESFDPNGSVHIIEEEEQDQNDPTRCLDDSPPHKRKLFILGLCYNTNEQSLVQFYERFGTVVEAEIARFPHDNNSRGFGFVTFCSVAAVDAAMEARPHQLDSRFLSVRRAVPLALARNPNAHVMVESVSLSGFRSPLNLGPVRQYFSRFGVVRAATPTHVTFADYDSVDRLIFADQEHMIAGCRVTVAPLLSRDEEVQAEIRRRRRDERRKHWQGVPKNNSHKFVRNINELVNNSNLVNKTGRLPLAPLQHSQAFAAHLMRKIKSRKSGAFDPYAGRPLAIKKEPVTPLKTIKEEPKTPRTLR